MSATRSNSNDGLDPHYTQWKHIVPTGILERHTIDFSSCSSVERASLDDANHVGTM